jgi:two-component system phosphate regulon sensor histidine kinase PhoR
LRTLYKQKQLAEVKNDFINNITHEFKTPIATISSALEAMKNFNALQDRSKTENYIAMANTQVNKLNIMVEKILETATLSRENFVLNKKLINIAVFLDEIIKKYKVLNPDNTFIFECSPNNKPINLDPFHFENAIGNIIDNAVKYGGNKITIMLDSSKIKTSIIIKDDGIGIEKIEKEKVFDQFYRVSTGDMHDVKGSGIGLFYAKKIIETHGGTIKILYDNDNNTMFKIELLNE